LALYKSDLNKKRKSLKINKTLSEGERTSTILSEFPKTSNSDSEAYELFLDDYTFDVLVTHIERGIYYDTTNNNEMTLLSSDFFLLVQEPSLIIIGQPLIEYCGRNLPPGGADVFLDFFKQLNLDSFCIQSD